MPESLLQYIYTLPPIVLGLIAFLASYLVSLYAVRKIIYITENRKIYDVPDDIRKFHGGKIPSLGGIGIFIGYLIIASFFIVLDVKGWNFIVVSSIILFFVGIYDDVMNMKPFKKLLAQLLASFIAIYFADIRLVHLEGILGIGILPYWLSIGFTTLLCTFFINVFNFIDGIDGLACITAMFYCLLFGILFVFMGHIGYFCVAFSLAGATAGLLYYNYAPAKIYMGDTGSMLLGFSIFIFALQAIQIYTSFGNHLQDTFLPYIHNVQGFLVLVISILFLPIFDAFRVFFVRALKGISPLKADRSHLHYYLLDAGFSHTRSVWILLGINLLIIVLGVGLQRFNPIISLFCFSFVCGVATYIINKLRKNAILIKH